MDELEDLRVVHQRYLDKQRDADIERGSRDALISLAVQEGVTPYRIAKALDIAESTVARIVERRRVAAEVSRATDELVKQLACGAPCPQMPGRTCDGMVGHTGRHGVRYAGDRVATWA